MDLTKVVDFQAAGQRHGTGRRQSHGGDRQPRGPFQDRLRLREALFHLTLTGLYQRAQAVKVTLLVHVLSFQGDGFPVAGASQPL